MNSISCNCRHNKSNSQRKIVKINAKIDIDNLPNTHGMPFKPHLTCTEESTFQASTFKYFRSKGNVDPTIVRHEPETKTTVGLSCTEPFPGRKAVTKAHFKKNT